MKYISSLLFLGVILSLIPPYNGISRTSDEFKDFANKGRNSTSTEKLNKIQSQIEKELTGVKKYIDSVEFENKKLKRKLKNLIKKTTQRGVDLCKI